MSVSARANSIAYMNDPVPTGGTFAMPYPTGINQAILAGSTGCKLTDWAGETYLQGSSGFGVAFGASQITLTNNSGHDWPAGTYFVSFGQVDIGGSYYLTDPAKANDLYDRAILEIALGGPLTPGSTITLTASITGATDPVTALTSASLTVGAATVTLTGTGLTRTGTIPAVAAAGAVIAAFASAVADGRTVAGSAVETVQPATADIIVTSIGDWNTDVRDASAANLDGKTVLLDGNFPQLTMPAKALTNGLTIVGAPGNSVVGINATGASQGVVWVDVKLQMTGWPATHGYLVYFGPGAHASDWRFVNCGFRHGYGPDQDDFDMLFEYPEYTRVDNNLTATTSGTAQALTWLDPAMNSGFIEIFNNGTQNVSVQCGGPGVTVAYGGGINFGSSSAPQYFIAPGTRGRASFGPQTGTHIALAAQSGTVAVNARTEIGLSAYLADAFGASGGLNIANLEIINCDFSDLSNAVKVTGITGRCVVMDNRFRRICMDVVSLPLRAGSSMYVLRNFGEVPFSRSGVDQGLNGDARDPHGDWVQTFRSEGLPTDGLIVIAGNRSISQPVREGVTSQGIFSSDGQNGYGDVFAINNLLVGGSGNGLQSDSLTVGSYLFGNTTLRATLLSTGASQTRVKAKSGYSPQAYVARNLTQGLVAEDMTFGGDGNVNIRTTPDPAACLPSIAALGSATNRAEADAATATAAEAAGTGSAATADVIDWSTSDPEAVVRWSMLHPGSVWPRLINRELSEVVTSVWRRVFVAGEAVPIAGTEIQVASDAAGSEIVTDWTSAAVAISRGQYARLRATNSPLNNVATEIGFDWGAHRVSFTSTTEPLFEARGAAFDGASAYRATGLTQVAGTEGMFSLWFRNTQATWNSGIQNLFQLRVGSTVILALNTSSSRRLILTLPNDSTAPPAFYAAAGNVQFELNRWYHIMGRWTATGVQIYINGSATPILNVPFTAFNLSGQTITAMGFGSAATNSAVWLGDIGHLWLSTSQSLDLSVQANREKFILAGAPVDLELDGSGPTGTAPEWYFDGNAPDWFNQGTGPDGTLVGALTASYPPPSVG